MRKHFLQDMLEDLEVFGEAVKNNQEGYQPDIQACYGLK
jgi:hypothetical protein